jgi:hypothetical protein
MDLTKYLAEATQNRDKARQLVANYSTQCVGLEAQIQLLELLIKETTLPKPPPDWEP